MIEQFQEMPKGMQIAMAVMGGTSLLGIAAMIDSRALIVVAIGLVLIAFLVVLWRLYLKWRARQRAKALSGQIGQNASSAPSAVNDPARRARLDDLRQNFQKGVSKFQAAGKDLYSLPWYVVCGEPGSGKTEAVRHCNVGFPPGLQDEMQGAGGTLNMHWWFTNHAVLLDTAGKLLFSEAPPGSTNEWQEFLGMLRKARPNCPINGLLLVIPSESLVKDSFEDIQKKAGKIARQLDVIQRTLDVRFPVFVLITKCDLINGFREFFSGIKDPQLQHQMTGWSNPDPLDTPFRPDAVDTHLGEVVRRISRRRLGLLRDPIPVEAGGRRVDEVDALFALPSSVAALAPRLRKYLETIFVAGEWSSKPLFLRGIYFTSALTEGAALDAELASALGVPVDNLPEGKAWERERSFFLRDLFLQKVFKERGLVTRATNTKQLLRRRQWIFGGVAVTGLALLVLFSVLGRNALRRSIGDELGYWQAAARPDDWTREGLWRPIVTASQGFQGNDIIRVPSGEETLVRYHALLQKRVEQDLRIPWIFKPLEAVALRANPNRRRAQRILFEAGVVKPLVVAARETLQGGAPWTPLTTSQLAALVHLEGQIHLRDLPGFNTDIAAEEFFDPLLGPWLQDIPERGAIEESLLQVFEWTYARGGDGVGKWPSPGLTAGVTLRENLPIRRGFESLEAAVNDTQRSQEQAFALIRDGRLTVVRLVDAETAFLRAASLPRSATAWQDEVVRAWTELDARRAPVLDLIERGRAATGVEAFTLEGGYRAVVDRVRGEAVRASEILNRAILAQRAAAEAAERASSGPEASFRLYSDIRRRLTALDQTVATILERSMPASEQAQLQELDMNALRAAADGTPSFAARAGVYADAMARLGVAATSGDGLIGRLADTVGRQASALVTIREQADKYDGPRRSEFGVAVRNLLDAGEAAGVQGLLQAYRRELEAAFAPTIGFPLGTGAPLTPAAFRTTLQTAERAAQDAAAQGLPAEPRRLLDPAFERARTVAAFGQLLVGPGGESQKVRVLLVRDRDQQATIERVLGPGQRQLLSRVYRSARIAGRDFRTVSADGQTVLELALAEAPPDLELSTTADPKPTPDARHTFSGGWGILRLLQDASVRRPDGRQWETVVRVTDAEGEMALALIVEFERGLPPVAEWPSAR